MSLGKHVIVGGLGNLGRHMKRALLAQGLPTSVIDRGDGSGSRLEKSVDFCPHRLGIDDPASLTEALHGSDTVYSMVTPDVQHGTQEDFVTTNQAGVRQLVDACKEAGVHKLVYVSSMAVTNHFIPSVNQNEQDPLPDIDTYVTSYDITKRRGEEIVLEGNEKDKLHSCALRLGAVLAGPSDYNFRSSFASPGRIITIPSARIDHISAKDVCKAMICASEKLNQSDSNVSGQALFVTKCASGQAPKVNQVAKTCAELLDWPLTILPSPVFSLIRGGTRLKDAILEMTFDANSRPGIPPHLFMDIANYEQTFDNSLARELLDFEPDETWEEAVGWVVEEYKNQKA